MASAKRFIASSAFGPMMCAPRRRFVCVLLHTAPAEYRFGLLRKVLVASSSARPTEARGGMVNTTLRMPVGCPVGSVLDQNLGDNLTIEFRYGRQSYREGI
jgi:hypothetical protein